MFLFWFRNSEFRYGIFRNGSGEKTRFSNQILVSQWSISECNTGIHCKLILSTQALHWLRARKRWFDWLGAPSCLRRPHTIYEYIRPCIINTTSKKTPKGRISYILVFLSFVFWSYLYLNTTYTVSYINTTLYDLVVLRTPACQHQFQTPSNKYENGESKNHESGRFWTIDWVWSLFLTRLWEP